jgi:hypothetical protein
MKFLADRLLYSSTEECLRFLRDLGDGPDDAPAGAPERFHLYWYGTFSRKQAFAVKSILATQDLASIELWLWLDGESGYDGHAENRFLRPLLPFLQVRRFDPAVEAVDTPAEGRPGLDRRMSPTRRSNLFRHLALYKHGGTYADMDTMFLRDMRVLFRDPYFSDEFCPHWSSLRPCGNSALMRLRQRSDTGRALLARCVRLRNFRPRTVLRFEENRHLDLMILPCVFFDPLWLHHDRRSEPGYAAAPYDRFEEFFGRFEDVRRQPTIRSYREFFPGAFTYHWHNLWDAPEHEDSYFGLFNREFEQILGDKLGIDVSCP